MSTEQTILSRLMAVLEERNRCHPPNSYTVELLDGGIEAIARKIVEETEELIEAARAPDRVTDRVVHEAADLVYHLCVLLTHSDVAWERVEDELNARFGVSGLDEKALRKPTTDEQNE